jgi:hypothetical protein
VVRKLAAIVFVLVACSPSEEPPVVEAIGEVQLVEAPKPPPRPPSSEPVRTPATVSSSATEPVWHRATLTYYTAYPEPGSEECVFYNGCAAPGVFAALDEKKPESWVKAHNIASVHSRDFPRYKLKTLRLRQDSHQIDVTVYDMCADSDCSGCCSENLGDTGFLLDLESYTVARFGTSEGVVEWTCLDCD